MNLNINKVFIILIIIKIVFIVNFSPQSLGGIMSDVSSFKEIVGMINLKSPYLEGTNLMDEAIVQCLEAICCYDKDSALKLVYSEANRHCAISVSCIEHGMIESRIMLRKITGYVEFFSAAKNVTMNAACTFLIENLHYVQLARLQGQNHPGGCGNSNVYMGRDPVVVVPDSINLQGEDYCKSSKISFLNYSGAVDFCVVTYTNENRSVYLPLTLYRKNLGDGSGVFLALGLPESKLKLLGANVLNSKRNMNVLLFENLRIAAEFQSRIKDSSSISQDAYIATSHYGGSNSIENVDLDCLRGQNVYFVPALQKSGYLNVNGYAEKCIAAGANSVRVVLDPILEYPINGYDEDYATFGCPFERFVVRNAYCFKEKELSPMIHRIVNYAIPYDKYESWAQEHMLNKIENSPSSNGLSSIVSNGYDMVRKPLGDKDDDNVSLHNILSSDKVSMLVGYSHEGKTIVGMSLILSRISGIDMFIFTQNRRGKVLLVDSESGEDFIHEVLLQLSRAYDINERDLESFKYISLLDMPHDNDYNFDLLSEATQAELKAYVVENGVDLVVLDNLQSMFENATSSSKTLFLIVKFVELMQSIGVAVLLVHHTLESNKRKPQGLTQLVNRMRNIMLLEGFATLSQELMKLGDDEVGDPFVQKFIDHEGIIVRLVFTKCNSYPHLRNKKFLYHLHYVNIRTQEPRKWIAETDDYDAYDDNCMLIQDSLARNSCIDLEPCVPDINNIKPADDFQKYCELVKGYAVDHPDFNGVQIQKKLLLSKKEVKNLLNYLVDSGSLDRSGTTSNTRYRIRFEDDQR